ncbi:SAM-dependent methyltransferase [Microbispora siamensis]
MDRQLLSAIAHRDRPIAAPVSAASLDRLLRRAALPEGARILDLGCGAGEWSLRALELVPSACADGVDISPHAVAAANEAAVRRGLADRLTLHTMPADAFTAAQPYDLALCVGSTGTSTSGRGPARSRAGPRTTPAPTVSRPSP